MVKLCISADSVEEVEKVLIILGGTQRKSSKIKKNGKYYKAYIDMDSNVEKLCENQ